MYQVGPRNTPLVKHRPTPEHPFGTAQAAPRNTPLVQHRLCPRNAPLVQHRPSPRNTPVVQHRPHPPQHQPSPPRFPYSCHCYLYGRTIISIRRTIATRADCGTASSEQCTSPRVNRAVSLLPSSCPYIFTDRLYRFSQSRKVLGDTPKYCVKECNKERIFYHLLGYMYQNCFCIRLV